MLNYRRVYIYTQYIYIWEKCGWLDIWKMGKPRANLYHLPHPVFSSILYVHVSEMLCTCQRCCARFPAVVHVSQKLCTCHRSCARFTSPLIMLNCIHTERILISKSIGATKHVLPINLYSVYIYICMCIHIYNICIYIYIYLI